MKNVAYRVRKQINTLFVILTSPYFVEDLNNNV